MQATTSTQNKQQHDRYAELVNTVLAELKAQRGIDVVMTYSDTKDRWTASALRGDRMIEVGAGKTGEQAVQDLFVRIMLEATK